MKGSGGTRSGGWKVSDLDWTAWLPNTDLCRIEADLLEVAHSERRLDQIVEDGLLRLGLPIIKFYIIRQ